MKAVKRSHEFKALELKITENSVSPHIIYFKEHAVREHTPDKPSGRTLFIVNLPPYVDEKGLTNAFSEAGKIKSVQLLSKPNNMDKPAVTFIAEDEQYSFKVAYLVFEKVVHLDKALKLTQLRPMNSESHQIKLGLKKWIDSYNNDIILPKVLKDKVESFMKVFDEKQQKLEKKEKELAEEDDEGWVTVTKRGKIQSFARSEKVETKIMAKEERNKKRKELKNFYTFQIRESKMKHIVALRQKFEEDKKKIAQIKQSRRFKPF